MLKNKYLALLFLCFLVFLLLPQGTTASPLLQTQDEFQMRNNETSAQIFSIKLFGGLGKLVGQNDVNENLNGWNQLLNDSANMAGFGISGEISPLGYSPSFGGELIFNFNPRFSIGLGAEYLRFTKQSTKILTLEGESIDFSIDPSISAIPITLSFYYGIPLGNFLNVVVGVGGGYYLGQYKNSTLQIIADEQVMLSFRSNKNTIGAHGSLTFEFNIGRSLALIFGVSGRMAKLKNLMGTETFTYTTPSYTDSEDYPDLTLWYVEDEIFEGRYYSSLIADNVKPETSYYRNVREAEISLSSMTLQIGILIRFGKQ
ncbi:MAG: hypothetical protein MUP98_05590 [Candidatus Aminicenantes bacterium]|nr:hypothetical protein [Candidatus Aminicenantes bacterium]